MRACKARERFVSGGNVHYETYFNGFSFDMNDFSPIKHKHNIFVSLGGKLFGKLLAGCLQLYLWYAAARSLWVRIKLLIKFPEAWIWNANLSLNDIYRHNSAGDDWFEHQNSCGEACACKCDATHGIGARLEIFNDQIVSSNSEAKRDHSGEKIASWSSLKFNAQSRVCRLLFMQNVLVRREEAGEQKFIYEIIEYVRKVSPNMFA